MPSETNLRADLLRCFADKRLDELLEETPRQHRLRLLHDFTLWGRAAQFEPESKDWRLWLVLGGRGAGKSRTGAEWVIREIRDALVAIRGGWKILASVIAASAALGGLLGSLAHWV